MQASNQDGFCHTGSRMWKTSDGLHPCCPKFSHQEKKSHHTLGLPWWPLANLTGEGLAKICWQLSLVFVFVLVCQLQWSGLEESSFACVCKSKGFYSGSDHACRGKLKQPALQCHGHKHLSQDNLFHWYLIGMVPLEQCGYTFLMSTTEKCL